MEAEEFGDLEDLRRLALSVGSRAFTSGATAVGFADIRGHVCVLCASVPHAPLQRLWLSFGKLRFPSPPGMRDCRAGPEERICEPRWGKPAPACVLRCVATVRLLFSCINLHQGTQYLVVEALKPAHQACAGLIAHTGEWRTQRDSAVSWLCCVLMFSPLGYSI